MTNIQFNTDSKLFTLRTKASIYILRIAPNGALLHTGYFPVEPNSPSEVILTGIDSYEEPNWVWDEQGTRYELPAYGDISYHDTALKVSFPELAAPLAAGEAPNLPVRDVRLRYHSHTVSTDASPGFAAAHGRPTSVTTPRETLSIRLKDTAYDFYVTLNYRLTPEHDIIERWLHLSNETGHDVNIESLAFGTLHVPTGEAEITRITGAWAREFAAVRHNLEQGIFVLDQRGLNTGHSSNPFFLLNEQGQATEAGGDVYFGALAYSGNWNLRFETFPTHATRVHGGYEPTDFALNLAPGETHTTAAFVHGVTSGGWSAASRRLHAFARDYVLPGFKHDEFRPVLYNGWEAAYFELTVENQIETARKAAAIGIELYCIDDGWFGARRSDNAGLGDWTVSADVFPDGLKPIIDEVKRLGMRFGLWVEPEMVNPESDLYRAHPEWVLHFSGRPRTEGRRQLILDFGRQEVVDFIFNSLDKLVRENDITFFKWDMNRYATEPGSPAGKNIWRAHVSGVYSIMDRLRAAHPTLDIQSCSGGGGRIDLGILQRTDQGWTSDNTDAVDRVFIEDGYSLAYPLRAMESWVTHEHNHQTGRLSTLDLRFDVAMRGALGIGSDISKLQENELSEYKRKIAFYKSIRHIVQTGDLYRLHIAPNASIWEIVLPDSSEAVYSIVVTQHPLGIHRSHSRLQGLTASAAYSVTDEHGAELGRYTGFQLATLGLPGDTVGGGIGRAVHSRTLRLQRI